MIGTLLGKRFGLLRMSYVHVCPSACANGCCFSRHEGDINHLEAQFKGRDVLELGSGIGLCGIVAAQVRTSSPCDGGIDAVID